MGQPLENEGTANAAPGVEAVVPLLAVARREPSDPTAVATQVRRVEVRIGGESGCQLSQPGLESGQANKDDTAAQGETPTPRRRTA